MSFVSLSVQCSEWKFRLDFVSMLASCSELAVGLCVGSIVCAGGITIDRVANDLAISSAFHFFIEDGLMDISHEVDN